MLTEQLPVDSALVRAEVGPAAHWGVTEHLLASLIETVDAVSWRPVLPQVKKGWKPPPPLHIDRPVAHGVQQSRKQKRKATSADLKRMFGGGRYVGGGGT